MNAPALVILFSRLSSDQATLCIRGLMSETMHLTIFHDYRNTLNAHCCSGNGSILAIPASGGDALLIVVRERGEVVASAIFEIRLGRADAIGVVRCADRLSIEQYDALICRGIQTALERVFGQEEQVA